MQFAVDGKTLTLNQVILVAQKKATVYLSPHAKNQVQRTFQALQNAISNNKKYYGVNTGFGALSEQVIAPKQIEVLQERLILSHAVGVGDPFDEQTARALILLRANTLASGHSGSVYRTKIVRDRKNLP
jgi:histidine ammonia-lyase